MNVTFVIVHEAPASLTPSSEHPAVNLTVFPPPCSKRTLKIHPRLQTFTTLCVCVPPSLLPDYGVDRPGVREQRSHQHRRGSQLPEVPPHLLPPEPVIPPHWRGLGPGIQPWPKGEVIETEPAKGHNFISVSWLHQLGHPLQLQTTFWSVCSGWSNLKPNCGGAHWLPSLSQSLGDKYEEGCVSSFKGVYSSLSHLFFFRWKRDKRSAVYLRAT